MENRIVLMVEGPTASGKTTLVNILGQEFDAKVVSEPFDKWQNVGNSENLFETFRENPTRWAYTFQCYSFITEVKAFEDALKTSPNRLLISDRSMYSGLCCFTKMFHDEGYLTDLEWHLYNNTIDWVLSYFSYIPDAFIYLRTPPEICYERNKERRKQANVPLHFDYFVNECRYHDDWLLHKKNCPKSLIDVPVLLLDGSQNFKDDPKVQAQIVEAVRAFIDKTIHFSDGN